MSTTRCSTTTRSWTTCRSTCSRSSGCLLGTVLGNLDGALGRAGLPRLPGRTAALSDRAPARPHLLALSFFLVDYPFADRLYPAALDVIARLRSWGPTVILSDGDVVFQPRKVQQSGLWQAVEATC